MRSKSKDIILEPVTNLILLNSWAAPNPIVPGIYKDRGRAFLVGTIDGTGAGAPAAFQLPSIFVPPGKIEPMGCMAENAAGNVAIMVMLSITVAGLVSFYTVAGAGLNGNSSSKFLLLEGVSWRL